MINYPRSNYQDIVSKSGFKDYKFLLCPEWIYNHLVRSNADIYNVFTDGKIFDLLNAEDIIFIENLNTYYKLPLNMDTYPQYIGNYSLIYDSPNIDKRDFSKYTSLSFSNDPYHYGDDNAINDLKNSIKLKLSSFKLKDKDKNVFDLNNNYFKIIICKDIILVTLKEGFDDFINSSDNAVMYYVTELNKAKHSVTNYIDYSCSNIFELFIRLVTKRELGYVLT